MADALPSLTCWPLVTTPHQLSQQTMITYQWKWFTFRPCSATWKEASPAALQQYWTAGFSCSMPWLWNLSTTVKLWLHISWYF